MGMVVTERAFFDPFITAEARPYLQAQKGSLDKLTADRSAWDRAYARAISDDYRSMVPHLPPSCEAILDIGGGMGGIDILLWHHYRKIVGTWSAPQVLIVDGENDPPTMTLHRKTFSNAKIAGAFLEANGVVRPRPNFMSPVKAKAAAQVAGLRPAFDLVISLGAWCFHIEPAEYLPFVLKACKPGAVLIIDMRFGKPKWQDAMNAHFTFVDIILGKPKFERVVFHAR